MTLKPASPRSLDRRRRNKQPTRKQTTNTGARKIFRYSRFVDVASSGLHAAAVITFVAANPAPTVQAWRGMSVDDLVRNIRCEINKYPWGRNGSSFQLLLESKYAALVVGTFSEPTLADQDDEVELAIRTGPSEIETIILDSYTWGAAKRKFSLPNRGYVRGPYLGVFAVDIFSKTIIRARVWPMWMRGNRSHCAIVRSNLERIAVAEIDAAGRIGFTPTSKDQLVALQTLYSRFWTGNISWSYLPDILLMPDRGGLVTMVEIFGLSRFKRYEAGIAEKHTKATAAELDGQFRYAPFKPERGSSYEKAIVALREAMISACAPPRFIAIA